MILDLFKEIAHATDAFYHRCPECDGRFPFQAQHDCRPPLTLTELRDDAEERERLNPKPTQDEKIDGRRG